MTGTKASGGRVPACEWKAGKLVAVSFHDFLEQKSNMIRRTLQEVSLAAECMGWVSARRFRKGQGGRWKFG